MPPLNSTKDSSKHHLNYIQSDANNNTEFIKKEETLVDDDIEISKEFKYFHVRKPIKDKNTIRYIYIDETKFGLVWPNIITFFVLHIYYAYALYTLTLNMFTNRRNVYTWIFHYFYAHLAGIGITVGAHRLWAHKSFEASLPMRIFLCMCFTIAGQNDLITWVRDHRVHHKFTESDADPHNSKRGMFFAHVGWLLTKKHPDVILKGKGVPMDDLKNDYVITFHRKFYIPFYFVFRLIIPFFLPVYFWNETFNFSLIGLFSSYIGVLHATWFVNSAAHLFGDRPYNKKIQPRNNFFVNLVAMGEGMHNFHHAFPFDYSIDEHGSKLNLGKRFIEICEKIGLATKLRRASPELIKKTKLRVLTESTKEEDHYLNPHPYC